MLPPILWQPRQGLKFYELSKRFGKLPFSKLFERAVKYAEEGVVIQPIVGKSWISAFNLYKDVLNPRVKPEYAHWFDTFAPEGKSPRIGEVWKAPYHAESLRLIAESGAETFYRGILAKKIVEFSRETGGYFTEEDLASFSCKWVEPISVNYRGYEIYEIPPNGQGIVTLMALNILKNCKMKSLCSGKLKHPACFSPIDIHRVIEAVKLSFADAKKYIADPDYMEIDFKKLLYEDYARGQFKEIGDRASFPSAGKLRRDGTVYLATADRYGNMVSYIQSNYMGFGSGLVVPKTGIALHNRGKNFSFKRGHPNCIAPRKRPYHTIIPGFIMQGNRPVGPFGVMGGFFQPQGQLQILINLIDGGLNPQAALDAPRWQWTGGKKVLVEHDFSPQLIEELENMGHEIVISEEGAFFGRGQVIEMLENGVYCCGTEKRCDSGVAAY